MNDKFEQKYWEERYSQNLGSGEGSRGDLLKFKAEYLNEIFRKYDVESVFDFGCGDGYLANLLDCKQYYGVDISLSAVQQCRKLIKKPDFIFEHGRFVDYPSATIKRKFNGLFGVDVDAIMCVDVVYHIMNERLVEFVLRTMFETGARLVILYTIPNDKMDGTKDGGIYHFNTDSILAEVTQGHLLVATAKPRGISGAAFYVWRHNAN